MEAHVVINEFRALDLRAVPGDDLRIIGHHGAVVMVIPQALVNVVSHTGVEDGVQAQLGEELDVPVGQLGREARGVAGNGGLALQIQIPAAEGAVVHGKAQLGEEGVPEGQQLPHVQAQGESDFPPLPRDGLVVQKQLPLEGVQIPLPAVGLSGHRAVTAVAADEGLPSREGVDGELAVVAAEAAGPALRLLGKARQGLPAQQGAGLARSGLTPSIEGRAKRAHQPGDIRADDLHPHLLLKGPEDGLVVKGPPLDHHVPAQLLGAGGPDDLINGVFHHRDGQARRDILNAGPVLLGLLHAGVHKDRAAAPQVHGTVREEAQLGKLLHVVAQGLGEGLEETAAAGGTGLI